MNKLRLEKFIPDNLEHRIIKRESAMTGIKFRIITSITALLIIISCSQKYDESGIFDPQNPDFFADTLSEASHTDTIVLAKDRITQDYIYLGRDIPGGDTVAWAESAFRFDLPSVYGLDSSYITYKLYEYSDTLNISQYFDGKLIEVLRIQEEWTADSIVYPLSGLIPVDTVTLKPDTSGVVFTLRLDLSNELISDWTSADTTGTAGIYLRCLEGSDITRVIKFYSSAWAYDSQKPKLTAYFTFPDSLTATDGSDSTLIETKETYVSEDVTVAYKSSSCIELTDNKFKLGGISGESYLCRIPLDTIPSDAVVLTGRISLTAVEETDPVYGSISSAVSTDNEICIYFLTDSLWYTPGGAVNYDSSNVWTYKINLGGDENYLLMDTPLQKWINEPETNFGFLITSKDWGNPFGYSVFEKPVLNISYIKTDKTE